MAVRWACGSGLSTPELSARPPARLRPTRLHATLAVDAQGCLGSCLQPFLRNGVPTVAARAVRASLPRAHSRFDLVGFEFEHALRGGLHLPLEGDVGHVGGVLIDGADLAGHFALVAREDRVVL